MRFLISLLIGYLLGSLSPASLLARLKQTDLRENGTGNLGATNTILVMGKKLGLLVMLLDIFKSYLAAKIAEKLFADFALAGFVSAFGAVLGHIYSLYLHFHGGKGVAAFVGMIIFYRPGFFFLLAGLAIVLMLVTNLGVVGPTSAAVLFPLLVLIDSGNPAIAGVCAAAGALVLLSHRENIRKIRSGEEILVRPFLKKVLNTHIHM